MKIITGSTGTAHVTSNNDGELNQGIFGAGLVVLKNGYQLEAQIKDANTITIKDGDLVMQGRHALIEPGTTEDVTIMTGAVGMKRIDLIVARYTLDESTGYERITLEVITGEETEGTPVEPAYVQGNIRTGSLVAEMPLYKVSLSGINIDSITPNFGAQNSIVEDVNYLISETERVKTISFEQWITLSEASYFANIDIAANIPQGYVLDAYPALICQFRSNTNTVGVSHSNIIENSTVASIGFTSALNAGSYLVSFSCKVFKG